ncbi:choice-of-anchor M domain-containing protein [Auritidibacter ignavus]|uniref:Choice-of-anchor M domain-containing protein n=1 Tax=Auritidibacter ignavus TaxID=678932 RepID=A0AAJ6DCL9_9MICC|nr:choice-of-anchor M domain-containing protein [Auritidibacter ignavus]WGH93584.1 choice-of-anchor M domain-containing protein [Auritidibacter ignavus]
MHFSVTLVALTLFYRFEAAYKRYCITFVDAYAYGKSPCVMVVLFRWLLSVRILTLKERFMRVFRATCASLAAVAITAFSFATTPAFAGPDDDRSVETKAHVDAPKVFWNKEANTFDINSQSNGKTAPLDKTANWVGRGYNYDGSQNYVFPVTNDHRLGFLGKDGQLLYMAPQVPGPGNSPIWSGFGADTAVPIEQFRDGNFALELVGFNGPGQMNMFNYSTFGDLPVTRLFSSHDKVSRTVWLDPGTHTHNITTFTKPGRYEVTFDASARKSDGSFTASKPTTLVWRVGGTNPADEKLGDVRVAYDQAAGVTGNSAPSFTIAPHAGNEKDGDKNLTDLTFNAGNDAAEGTVVFYIDGYHLAEIPVTGGKATWSEMIGSHTSSFQAVFVPTQGAARWISAPLTSSTGQTAVSTTNTGQFPTETPDTPAGDFSTGEVTVSSRDVSVNAHTQGDGNRVTIDTKPADDSLIYNITGGFYEEGYDEPTCAVDGVSGPGRRTLEVSREYCKGDEYTLRLTLEPQPRAAIGNTDTIDLGQVSNTGNTVQTQFSESGATTTPDPGDGSETPNPDDGNDGSDESLLNTPVTINNGHVDLRAMDLNGELTVALGDDSRQHAQESVTRTIDSTTLEVTKLAKVKREGNVLANPSYDVLGPKGTELYILPQAQQPGRVWPGFSSETLDRMKYPEGATMTLTPVSAPEGGKWFAYTENLGSIQTMYASSEKAADIPLPPGTHMHTAWAFTKPGTYTIDVTARAKQEVGGARSAGGSVTAKTQRLTFVVDHKPGGEDGDVSTPPSEKPSEAPGEQPTQEPPVEPSQEPTQAPSQEPSEEQPGEEPGEAPSQEPNEPAQPGESDNDDSRKPDDKQTEAPAEGDGSDSDNGANSTSGGSGDNTGSNGSNGTGANGSNGTASNNGNSLPRTGATVLPVGLTAGALAVAGVALLVAARRRKS